MPDYPAAPADARITKDGWFAPATRNDPLAELPDPVTRAFVIPIRKPIDGNMYDRVKRKTFQAVAANAQLVVFHMDTPGGALDAMEAISRVIMQDLADVRTVAYVDRNAYSAGALIAMACDEIVVAPGANFGDAMPILMTPGGGVQEIPEKVRGKIESAMKSQIRNVAQAHGYNVPMCEAMITSSIELWLIRNEQTAELRILDPRNPPPGILKPGEGQTDSAGRPLLVEPWEYLRRVDKATEPLTLTGDEAIFYGFARRQIDDLGAVGEAYNVAGTMTYLRDTMHEKVAAFLTSPAITGLLILLAIGGIYLEMNTPGIGVPAALACSAFAVLIASHFMLGLANWVEVVVFMIGMVLLILEIFVIPGFGVAGISGIALMVGALLAMVVPNAPGTFPMPSTDAAWEAFQSGLMALLLGFIGSVAVVVVLSRILPKTPIVNQLFLGPAEHSEEAPATDISPIRRIRPGDTGVVASTCRPVGQVRIGQDLIDAVANGTMIDRGTHVRVLRNDGNRLVIEPV
jgi:membrane-bound serine protease (ClpP class)